MNIRVLDGTGTPNKGGSYGFNRVQKDATMQPKTDMRFNRTKGSSSTLPGVGDNPPSNLQGFNRIMQGYQKGTAEDLDEWDFLVNIEHPVVMGGFEAYLDHYKDPMNGKKRDARRKRRQERKNKRASKKNERKSSRSERKNKRQTRRDENKARKDRRREARTAKKEERVARKMSRREEREKNKQARRDRKQQRLDDRKERQADRRERRSERQERRMDMKAGRAEARNREGGIFDNLADFGGDIAAPLINDFVGGGGMFENSTFSDLPFNDLPPDFEPFMDTFQDMDMDDALDAREDYADELDDMDDEEGGKSSMILPLIALGGLALVASKKKKRK